MTGDLFTQGKKQRPFNAFEFMKRQFCEYGEKIDRKLGELRQTQKWLVSQVKEDTGDMYFDSGYLWKILVGIRKPPKIIDSINKILEIT